MAKHTRRDLVSRLSCQNFSNAIDPSDAWCLCSAARRGDSTPELAADAQQMREEIASLKGMWDKLETVAGEGGDKSSAAAGPDENDYW